MAYGIIIFLVNVFERAKVFQRAADGFGEVLLAHEHPKALHAALRACLYLDGETGNAGVQVLQQVLPWHPC